MQVREASQAVGAVLHSIPRLRNSFRRMLLSNLLSPNVKFAELSVRGDNNIQTRTVESETLSAEMSAGGNASCALFSLNVIIPTQVCRWSRVRCTGNRQVSLTQDWQDGILDPARNYSRVLLCLIVADDIFLVTAGSTTLSPL